MFECTTYRSALSLSPSRRLAIARAGASCWSKRLRSARTRGTSEDLNVWPHRRRSSEPTVNRSIAQWAMSALFARTVSPSRHMGDVPPRARARLAGRSVSEPRALAERVGVYCLALAPRLSPQATAFLVRAGVLNWGLCTKNAPLAHIAGAKHAAGMRDSALSSN